MRTIIKRAFTLCVTPRLTKAMKRNFSSSEKETGSLQHRSNNGLCALCWPPRGKASPGTRPNFAEPFLPADPLRFARCQCAAYERSAAEATTACLQTGRSLTGPETARTHRSELSPHPPEMQSRSRRDSFRVVAVSTAGLSQDGLDTFAERNLLSGRRRKDHARQQCHLYGMPYSVRPLPNQP